MARMTESLYLLLLLSTIAIRRDLAIPWSEAASDCVVPNSKVDRLTSADPGSSESASITGTRIANVAEDSDLSTFLEELEGRLSRLERRLRAVEQPVWQMGATEEDWEICAEGPCRCQPEIKSVSCWRQDLLDLPAAQLVPRDVLKLDLGGNRLTALHRDTFLDMTRLNHLDLSDNSIEHLPLNLFFSLHAVTHLRLSKNLLRELHRSQFFRMRNLRMLDASSNRLRALPESLFLSTNLLVLLDLSCNRIGTLTVDPPVRLPRSCGAQRSSARPQSHTERDAGPVHGFELVGATGSVRERYREIAARCLSRSLKFDVPVSALEPSQDTAPGVVPGHAEFTKIAAGVELSVLVAGSNLGSCFVDRTATSGSESMALRLRRLLSGDVAAETIPDSSERHREFVREFHGMGVRSRSCLQRARYPGRQDGDAIIDLRAVRGTMGLDARLGAAIAGRSRLDRR
ncbi:uncharacterized protein LOC143216659 isoform X2 [Lasioglossum baleicum]|uniref:uncharacterized protein LOC143216659 isoform X2 n=1 Tax=Lasioglossum baleicum TaxID=434251 RepID=UPI003FCDBF9A